MVRLILNDDRGGVNPLLADLGHFVCVDGFGPVSPEERAAGLPGHGEAHRVAWKQVTLEKANGSTTVSSRLRRHIGRKCKKFSTRRSLTPLRDSLCHDNIDFHSAI